MKISRTKDLAPLREAAKLKIDADAESYRLNFITPGNGQAMAYQQKFTEASAFLLDPTLTELEVPHVFAEVGITASSAYQVAQVIVNLQLMWQHVSATIERQRMAAKTAVDLANTPAAITSASMVTWSNV